MVFVLEKKRLRKHIKIIISLQTVNMAKSGQIAFTLFKSFLESNLRTLAAGRRRLARQPLRFVQMNLRLP